MQSPLSTEYAQMFFIPCDQCDQTGPIYWTLGNFSKPVATISLPESPTLLGNFCKAAKILNFSIEIILGQLLETFGNFLLVTLHVIFSEAIYIKSI